MLNLLTTSLADTVTEPDPFKFSKNDNVKTDPSKLALIALTFSLKENERFDPFSTSLNTVARSAESQGAYDDFYHHLR